MTSGYDGGDGWPRRRGSRQIQVLLTCCLMMSRVTFLCRSHCYNCFLILRKNANLIINLFALMTDSNVSDIAMDRERTVSKIQDKFKLDLDDEQAVKYFQDLLESSIAALFPQIVEQLHTLAQYFRK